MASAKDRRSLSRCTSLIAANTSGGPSASRAATSSTRAASRDGGCTSLTSPQRWASAASIQRPVSSSSMAMWCGIRVGSRSVAASARVPALISGSANDAVSAA